MSRWLFLLFCTSTLLALTLAAPAARPVEGGRRPGQAAGTATLGQRCASTSDCAHGLDCADEQGALVGQCAAACSSDQSCEARFGVEAQCIGVDQCVLSCTQDSACPAGTTCNAHGWCEAQGIAP